MDNDLIFYEFSRSKVERGDFSHFLSVYAPDKLPAGRKLRSMIGTMVFMIEGYDDDPREVHTIPEVRRFYKAFHEAWPYWLYFCTLMEDGLKMMIFSCLDSFDVIQVDGAEKSSLKCDTVDVVKFVGGDFPHMNFICDRGQMFEHLIMERSKQVFEYFGLPFQTG